MVAAAYITPSGSPQQHQGFLEHRRRGSPARADFARDRLPWLTAARRVCPAPAITQKMAMGARKSSMRSLMSATLSSIAPNCLPFPFSGGSASWSTIHSSRNFLACSRMCAGCFSSCHIFLHISARIMASTRARFSLPINMLEFYQPCLWLAASGEPSRSRKGEARYAPSSLQPVRNSTLLREGTRAVWSGATESLADQVTQGRGRVRAEPAATSAEQHPTAGGNAGG